MRWCGGKRAARLGADRKSSGTELVRTGKATGESAGPEAECRNRKEAGGGDLGSDTSVYGRARRNLRAVGVMARWVRFGQLGDTAHEETALSTGRQPDTTKRKTEQ